MYGLKASCALTWARHWISVPLRELSPAIRSASRPSRRRRGEVVVSLRRRSGRSFIQLRQREGGTKFVDNPRSPPLFELSLSIRRLPRRTVARRNRRGPARSICRELHRSERIAAGEVEEGEGRGLPSPRQSPPIYIRRHFVHFVLPRLTSSYSRNMTKSRSGKKNKAEASSSKFHSKFSLLRKKLKLRPKTPTVTQEVSEGIGNKKNASASKTEKRKMKIRHKTTIVEDQQDDDAPALTAESAECVKEEIVTGSRYKVQKV